jgi:hypothetical protein
MRYYYLKTIRSDSGPRPTSLSVTPSQLTVGRQAPDNVASFQAALNQNPGSPATISVTSSSPSVTVSPATFALGGGNPLSQTVTVTGDLTGPNAVTLQAAAVGLPTRTVQVTRPAFQPSMISGLALWLDASDTATLFTGAYADRLTSATNPTGNGEALCRWEDKSGAGRHAYAFSDATRPGWAAPANGLNGLAGCSTGRWDRYAHANPTSTWLMVLRESGLNAEYYLLNNNPSFHTLAKSSFSGWNLSFVRDNQAWTNSGFALGTTPRLLSATFDGSAASFATVSGGTETVRQSITQAGTSPPSVPSFRWSGTLFEILHYPRLLTTTEKSAVYDYLQSKWGV